MKFFCLLLACGVPLVSATDLSSLLAVPQMLMAPLGILQDTIVFFSTSSLDDARDKADKMVTCAYERKDEVVALLNEAEEHVVSCGLRMFSASRPYASDWSNATFRVLRLVEAITPCLSAPIVGTGCFITNVMPLISDLSELFHDAGKIFNMFLDELNVLQESVSELKTTTVKLYEIYLSVSACADK